jgi:hypothetical protein
MSQRFSLTSKHTKSFAMMAGVGALLFVAGLLLSNVVWPAEKHAAEHAEHVKHAAGKAGHGDTHASDHATAGHQEAPHDSAHVSGSDSIAHEGGEQEVPADNHKGGHVFKFVSDAEPHAKAEHGDSHGHEHHSDHKENGIWRRAVIHPGQDAMTHHSKGEVTNSAKIGSSLFIGAFLWTAVALFGVFFIAIGYAANAGWYVAFKRVVENYYRFLPVGAILLLLVFFVFGKDVWEWLAMEVGTDKLIDGKRAFLNVGFMLGTGGLFIGILYPFFGHMFKKNSLAEDMNGGLEYYKKNIKLSAFFLPLFAIGFSATAFLWIMSVDPHWFSTIFGVYVFAGLFLSGITITMFITTHLREGGYLPNMTSDHLHDIGKFMFAFSVFWAYIWISQYLLIWYANIPEETIYYWNRVQNYPLMFALNVVINFAFPFISLMTREAKRQARSLRFVGRVIIFGRTLDLYLMVAPAVLGVAGGFTTFLMAIGAVLMVGAVFLFIVFKGLEDGEMEAKNHPFFGETAHHSTGV